MNFITKKTSLFLFSSIILASTLSFTLTSCNKQNLTQKQKTLENIKSIKNLPAYLFLSANTFSNNTEHTPSIPGIYTFLQETDAPTVETNTAAILIDYLNAEFNAGIANVSRLHNIVALASEKGKLTTNTTADDTKWQNLSLLVDKFKTKVNTIVNPEIVEIAQIQIIELAGAIWSSDPIFGTAEVTNTTTFAQIKTLFSIPDVIFNEFVNDVIALVGTGNFSSSTNLSTYDTMVTPAGGILYNADSTKVTQWTKLSKSIFELVTSILDNIGAELGWQACVNSMSNAWLDVELTPFTTDYIIAYKAVVQSSLITTGTTIQAFIAAKAEIKASAPTQLILNIHSKTDELIEGLKKINDEAKNNFINKIKSLANKPNYEANKASALNSTVATYTAFKDGWNGFASIPESEKIESSTTYENLIQKVNGSTYFVPCENKTSKWNAMTTLADAYINSLTW